MKKSLFTAFAIGLCFFFCINVNCQNSVKIGDQTWMTTNLNVSKFRNGDPIPEIKTEEEWINAGKNKQPAWCYYNNDPSNGAKYGKLYNWWAVNDPRGLAPEGWHIPSSSEFSYLNDMISEIKSKSGWDDYDAEITCSKCKGEGWYFQSTCSKCKGTQSVTVTYSGNGNNSTGFGALPGGLCLGDFSELGEKANFWTSNLKMGMFVLTNDDVFYFSELCNEMMGNSVRCIKDTKESIAEKEMEDLKKQQQKNLENFEIEFENLVENQTFETCFEFLIKNKKKIFEFFDNNQLKYQKTGALIEEVLIKLINEINNSMNINESEDFINTNSYFEVLNSKEFKDFEDKVSIKVGLSNSYWVSKSNAKVIEKFISFKSKIRRQRTKELTDLEKPIVGQWRFQSSKGITTIIDLKNSRDIEISEITKASGDRKTGVKTSKFGVWGYDGENLSFYPEWDFKIGVFSNSKIYEKNRKKISEKLEPKFLSGDKFSIKDYVKAITLQKEILLDLRPLLYEWGKDELGYTDAQKQLKELDICLASLINLVSKKNIDEITPLEGKEVRMDLPKIREITEVYREYYTLDAKTIESTEKFAKEVVQILIDAEKWNSFNLDKTDIIKYKLRIEGESAILEFGEMMPGKRIK